MIGILGISHKTAPLDIREKFALSHADIPLFAEELQKQANFSDIVVISTCNRTEIYFSQQVHDGFTASILLFNCLIAFKKIDFAAERFFYTYINDDAVAHLFKVCAGVDSMIVGEDQIIGQVKDAYVYCTELALTDAVLMRLFQKSFEAGKKVRTNTCINSGVTSVSYAAIEFCSSRISNFSETSVLLIGTGETGTLALQGFAAKGVTKIFVSNRTPEHATKIISEYSAEFIPINQLIQSLFKADIIITATNAGHAFITADQIRESIHLRNNKPQICVDLSVPRNIEEQVQYIEYCTLVCVDTIQDVIAANKDKRVEQIEHAEIIIQELVQEFMEWLSFRALQPAIRAINFHLQKIYRDQYHGYIVDSAKDVKENIKDFSGFLTQQYSRELIKNLKEITDNGRKELYLQVINDLFRLEK